MSEASKPHQELRAKVTEALNLAPLVAPQADAETAEIVNEAWLGLSGLMQELLRLEEQLQVKDAMIVASEEHTQHWEQKATRLLEQYERATREKGRLFEQYESLTQRYERLLEQLEAAEERAMELGEALGLAARQRNELQKALEKIVYLDGPNDIGESPGYYGALHQCADIARAALEGSIT